MPGVPLVCSAQSVGLLAVCEATGTQKDTKNNCCRYLIGLRVRILAICVSSLCIVPAAPKLQRVGSLSSVRTGSRLQAASQRRLAETAVRFVQEGNRSCNAE